MSKHAGGRWLLRLDDLDTPRQVPGMADDIMRTLESFGLLWDGEVARQSSNLGAYREAFEALQQAGVVYPCCCSRREIALAASAPHMEDDCLPYPGTCRAGLKTDGIIRSWRVSVPVGELCFHDICQGTVCQNMASVCGDFAVRRGDGEFAYQLAVVVDDYLAGVNQVVRGADLLASTPRQIHIQNILGYRRPEYCHVPLVSGPGGTKLSKRDNLISQQLGNLAGKREWLLLEVLSFLGQNPPASLKGSSCADILEWGGRHFDAGWIPTVGGEISIQPINGSFTAEGAEFRKENKTS